MVRPILLLGDPRLYETSAPVRRDELSALRPVVQDLNDTLLDYRARHGAGRAIAAPQIGVPKRVLYMRAPGGEPVAFLNPVLTFPSDDMMEVLDDCMSFPGLLVRVLRHRRCYIRFKDMDWMDREMALSGDLAELLQHEYDHLDGILATMRAADAKAFCLKGWEG